MKIILTLTMVILSLTVMGQDVNFTMYDVMPITLNPASTGVFRGDLRATVNYRNQWGAISNPFKTFSFSVDGAILRGKWKNAYLTTGISAFKDEAGATNFSTTKLNFSMASVLILDKHNRISAGLLGGMVQQSIDGSAAEWSTQFNGQYYDPSAPSYEDFVGEKINYFNVSTGAMWQYNKNAKTLSSSDILSINVGIAYHHANRPKTLLSVGDIDRLYGKWAVHSESMIGITNTKFLLKPKFLLNFQGPSTNLLFGLLVRYTLQEESKYTNLNKGIAIAVGSYYRYKDAIVPTIELEMSKFAIGLAYDINISQLKAASNGRGGPEIFIKYQSPNPFTGKYGMKSKARFHDF